MWLEPVLHGVKPAEADRKTLAREQRHRLIERETDDVGIGANNLDNEAACNALRCVTAGLAAPLPGSQVSFDVFVRQPFKAHPSLDQPLAEGPIGRYEADSGMDPVVTS